MPPVEAGTHRNDSGDSLNVAGILVIQGVEDVKLIHLCRDEQENYEFLRVTKIAQLFLAHCESCCLLR